MQGKIVAVHDRAKLPALVPEIRRELLKLALKNARKSVILLLLAGWFVAWLAWDSGLPRMAAVTAVLTLMTVVWRATFRRHDNIDYTVRQIDLASQWPGCDALLSTDLRRPLLCTWWREP